MDVKEIEARNRLIAEFDGWVEDPGLGYWHPVKNQTHYRKAEDFKYHSSWDWLMPVVERIEKEVSTAIFDGFSVVVRRNHCAIICHSNGRQDGLICQTPYGSPEPESKIQAVWEMIIQFITWYNQQTLSSPSPSKADKQ